MLTFMFLRLVKHRIQSLWMAGLLLSLCSMTCGQDSAGVRAGLDLSPRGLGVDAGIAVPSGQFQLACIGCRKGEQTAAATHIEDALKLMKKQSERASKKSRALLHDSMEELQALAERLRKGADISADHLEESFARAHHALAQHHYEQATATWARRQFRAAGEDLQAAAYYARRGSDWLGDKVEDRTHDAYVATIRAGSQLASGAKHDAEVVEGHSRFLTAQIRDFGKRVAASARARTARARDAVSR